MKCKNSLKLFSNHKQFKDHNESVFTQLASDWTPHIPGSPSFVIAILIYPFSPQSVPQEFLMM